MKKTDKKSSKKLTDNLSSKAEPQTLVLLDSHAIIHRAYHALPDFSSSTGMPTGALYGLSTMLMGIIEKFHPDFVIACYDLPQPTYRHEAYEAYKGTRQKTDDALVEQLKNSRKIFEAFSVPMYDMPGFEADDMLGTIVHRISETNKKGETDIKIIIASGDMDTMQLIDGDKVLVYTLKKGIKDVVVYDELAVLSRFGFAPLSLPDYKGLRGDPSDNIIGIKGIGEKTATTLITLYKTIEAMYEALKKDEAKFKKDSGLTDRMFDLIKNGEEEARFSKMLATIRRDAPITFSLPDKKWIDQVNIEKVEGLFREFEFRSLVTRVKEVFTKNGGKGYEVIKKVEDRSDTPKPDDSIKMSEDDQLLAQKLTVGLWVVDSNKTNPSVEDVLFFTKKDTLSEAEKVIIADLEKQKLLHVAEEIEWPLIPVVNLMHDVGVKIDVGYLKILAGEYHRQLSKLETKIWELAGNEFNINSPKQLGEILFNVLSLGAKSGKSKIKKTATGAMSTKESELEKMRGEHPIIDFVLEYRELAKLLSTYIDTIPTLVAEDGRLHATFLLAGTTTGRMASQDPNLQNIPIKTELGRKVRNAFVAEKGFKLVAIDYSQIELRIAAMLSKDEKLIQMFKSGIDIHTGVASQVFKVPEGEVTKDMRRKAKVINFGILYGMGVSALKTNLGGTREEAQDFYNTYFETFPGLAHYLNETKAEAERKGFTETMFDRRRHFQGFKSPLPFIRAMAERMAINAPIQGTEGDIVKIAMKNVHNYLKNEKLLDDARLILQVHDELVYEVREKMLPTIIPKIRKIMESVFEGKETHGVPVITEVEVGDNWGEMEDFNK
ncbi:MAG: DNA polymerase [bacterium]